MNEKEEIMLCMIGQIASLIMHDYPDMSLEEAFDEIFKSETYVKLMDERAHLYYQSPRYVYSFLKDEWRMGKLG